MNEHKTIGQAAGVTTKQQEREALERIRAILEAMPADSYCRVAFDGCVEDAAANIDDDAAYSMKGRWESAEKKRIEAEARTMDLAEALRDASDECEKAKRRIAELEASTIPADLWNEIYQGAKRAEEKAVGQMLEAADIMAQLSDHPGDIGFTNAVKAFRARQAEARAAGRIMGRLEGIAPDGAEF